MPPTGRFSFGSLSVGHDCTLVGPAQSKYAPSISTICIVLLLLHATWLSRHIKLIISAGEEICSQAEKLAKGKCSINNDITMLIYGRELFIIFLNLSNNISGDNPKERRLQQSGTLTQHKMIFSASI